jgi:hypothetical protein
MTTTNQPTPSPYEFETVESGQHHWQAMDATETAARKAAPNEKVRFAPTEFADLLKGEKP